MLRNSLNALLQILLTGLYTFDSDNDYERCLISHCVSVNTDEYNTFPHCLHASGNLTLMHLNCCSPKS